MGTKVNSNYEDLLTFTRASKGHALRPVSYGDELVTNGTFDSDTSGWTANQATISSESGRLKVVDSGAFSGAKQAISTKAGSVYVIQFDYDNNAVGVDNAYVALHNGDKTSTTITTGSNGDVLPFDDSYDYISGNTGTASIPFVALGNTTTILIGSSSYYTAYHDNVSVKEVTFDESDGTLTLFEHPNNVPRVEWDADRNRLGLLVEEARTNLFTESEELSSKGHSMNIDDNVAIAPDRTQTASFCKPDTSSSEHFIDDAGVTTGTNYAISCFAKQGPGDYLLAFRGSGLGGNPPRFNLATGTIDNEGASSVWSDVKIQEIGNGWYRCSAVGNPNQSTPLRFQITESDGNGSFAGDGTSGLYIWGCQIEQASFPTSYIKTTGATATRSADVASIPVADFGYNQKSGSFFVEWSHTDVANGDSNYLLHVNTNARFVYNNSGGSDWYNYDGVTSINYGALAADGTPIKLATAMDKDGTEAAVDGVARPTSTATPQENVALSDTLYIGTTGGGGVELNGHIKSIKYYPRALTAAQLQDLTS